jgi:hypothetical protein
MEEMDGYKIMHARNGREYRLPESPPFTVDGYCAETRTVYVFLDVSTMAASVNRFVISKQ